MLYFVDEALRTKLRGCCTVADFQLLLCGVQQINVNDWQASAEYHGYSPQDEQVGWFWEEVRSMTNEERGKLLFFCTGSVRAPAAGFEHLVGFNGGQQQRFTLARDLRGIERLPAASSCFNKLLLPAYTSKQVLGAKLRLAISCSQGFHEGAVADA